MNTIRFFVVGVVAFWLPPIGTASGEYQAWRHRAGLALLTTPDGADLPATAREENFPVLVRLDGENFDFSEARPDGADIRFSTEGRGLKYEIERWDAGGREAAIWVRIPVVRGNARQEITLHWGNAEAKSESDGQAVFNESNGYAVVMHLGEEDESLRDAVGTVEPTNAGTTTCAGAVGSGRRFATGQGIACGEKIAGLPSGAGPCTTEVWLRAAELNVNVVGWGNEQGQGKVVMQVNAPPHVNLDCYFSGANVRGERLLWMGEWVQVTHTYREGDTRIYMNGRLDGVGDDPRGSLNIRRPARMWLGGWYGNYQYAGDLDEVRISKVARSADWVKLTYENQKAQQTLVGIPRRAGSPAGSTPKVAPERLVVNEGTSATVTANAAGAEKTYWIVRRNGEDEVVACDRRAYTIEPRRVKRDDSWVLKFKAVYPDEVRTKEIPITVRESIPEPVFRLEAPTTWNGRDTIEVVPRIQNLAEMRAAGAGKVRYEWIVEGGAVSKQIAADRLILRRAQFSGTMRVMAFLDNGGHSTFGMAIVRVAEPATDPWVERTPEADEKPEAGQFYARDDKNEGTLHYRGTLDEKLAGKGDSVFLKLYADDKLLKSETRQVGDDKSYAFAVKLTPGLVKYRVEFGVRTGGAEKVLDRVGNLVCGDAYLIDGQSNALATDTREESPRETHEWIRSYGGPTGRTDGDAWVRNRRNDAERAGLARPNLWCSPVWKANGNEHEAELGWWGMELAKRLVAEQKVPIFIVNAAVGGSRIDEHVPAAGDRENLKTMYGRMLWRLRQARLTHGIRGVIWHQGENDQGAAGPSGSYGWQTYQHYFVDMAAAWKDDMPNVRRYYVFQIRPSACAMGGKQGSGDRLREAQRTLPRLFSNMSILSTLGITPPGGCHYPLEGWGEFARLIQPMIERDFYGKRAQGPIGPPNLVRAHFTGEARDEIALEFDQPVQWRDELTREIYLDNRPAASATGKVEGNVVRLKLQEPTDADRITYLKERDWSQERLIVGANGIAALTFSDVLIEATAAR